jgi:hypothetical protein
MSRFGGPSPAARAGRCYAEGAIAAGHEVRRIEVTKIEFLLLRSQVDFETGRFLPL